MDRGGIGTPYIIRSHEFPTSYPGAKVPGRPPEQTTMVGWRASRETMGGGVLIDKGYHPTYILLYLAGSEPVEVTAMSNTYVAQMDGEDTALVLVKFANGAIGQIFTGEGFVFPANDAKFHVIGERGEVYGNRQEVFTQAARLRGAIGRTFPVDPTEQRLRHGDRPLRRQHRHRPPADPGRQRRTARAGGDSGGLSLD